MLLWNSPSNSVPQPTGQVVPDEGLAIVESPISHTFVGSAAAAAASVRTPQSGRPDAAEAKLGVSRVRKATSVETIQRRATRIAVLLRLCEYAVEPGEDLVLHLAHEHVPEPGPDLRGQPVAGPL